jgi:carbon storage regulator
MLVLSRKVGEKVWIGDRIAVTIVRINGNSVRIGIEAPADMVVAREELMQRTVAGAACAGEDAAGSANVP